MVSKGCMIIVSVLKDIIWDIVNAAYPSLFVAATLGVRHEKLGIKRRKAK